MRRLFFLATVVATSACDRAGTTTPQPAPAPTAEQHFRQGQAYFDAGDYSAALDHFRRAHEKAEPDQRPALAYSIGVAAEKLGDCETGTAAYSEVSSSDSSLMQAATEGLGRLRAIGCPPAEPGQPEQRGDNVGDPGAPSQRGGATASAAPTRPADNVQILDTYAGDLRFGRVGVVVPSVAAWCEQQRRKFESAKASWSGGPAWPAWSCQTTQVPDANTTIIVTPPTLHPDLFTNVHVAVTTKTATYVGFVGSDTIDPERTPGAQYPEVEVVVHRRALAEDDWITEIIVLDRLVTREASGRRGTWLQASATLCQPDEEGTLVCTYAQTLRDEVVCDPTPCPEASDDEFEGEGENEYEDDYVGAIPPASISYPGDGLIAITDARGRRHYRFP